MSVAGKPFLATEITEKESGVMESYDPRKPIIKATEDDEPEVEGHRLSRINPEQAAEVESHHLKGKDERIARATEESAADHEPQVEGHRLKGPDEKGV